MDKKTLIINFILALVLYFGNGWLGKIKINAKGLFGYEAFGFNKVDTANFADHFFQKIVHPPIVVAIAAAILQYNEMASTARDLWLVVPLYWTLRIIHIFVWNIAAFTNWKYEILSMIISLLLGEGTLFYILRPLIDSNKSVFIDATEIRDAFWIAALSYTAKFIWDISKFSLSGRSVFPSEKRAQTISKRYYAFKWEYGAEIDVVLRDNYYFVSDLSKNQFLCLFYSIMIYEDHCRPKIIRWFEYLIKAFRWNSVMSLGIMQVQTKQFISNRTSIKMAIERLYTIFSKAPNASGIRDTLWDYNHGENYYDEVTTIYAILLREFGLSIDAINDYD